ncbi:hypothetical protein L486_07550 [Kwoniella mangroviensis CBS 10435]|uniref:Uncharacterized protein n=1 Tax=Kwoniella mangroviensis CBS 10435 TaxID=1331196 RepID=A0A1B9IHN6_9TREE|nr:hypothetical protein L486_07550 [Kwoniella mangroviensis CBS 10435]OCF72919.1 hypothetical protein I204_06149 [Kwoniella mangroviensis CBS 8886]
MFFFCYHDEQDYSKDSVLRLRGGGCFDWFDQSTPADISGTGHTPMLPQSNDNDPTSFDDQKTKSKTKTKSKDKDKTKTKSAEGDVKIKDKGKKFKIKNKKDGSIQTIRKNQIDPMVSPYTAGPTAGLGLGGTGSYEPIRRRRFDLGREGEGEQNGDQAQVPREQLGEGGALGLSGCGGGNDNSWGGDGVDEPGLKSMEVAK